MGEPTERDDGVALAVVAWEDERTARLRAEQQTELLDRYGAPDIEPDLPAEEMLATVLVTVAGEVAGCGSLRAYGPGLGELKRMYVRPAFRGRGLGRRVLAELERLAARHGIARLVLETGIRQPEAIRLYRSAGYRRIRNYGPYVAEPTSVCYARWLVRDAGTRVLVLDGPGAGTSAVASAVGDLLRAWGVAHARLDTDALCQVWPRPPADPIAQDLAFEGLAALAPGLATRGYRHVVLAGAVGDEGDRERYEQAFDGADVAIVRLDVSEPAREVAEDALRAAGWATDRSGRR